MQNACILFANYIPLHCKKSHKILREFLQIERKYINEKYMNETIGQEFFLTPSARLRQQTTAFIKSEFEKLKKQYSDESNWQIAFYTY